MRPGISFALTRGKVAADISVSHGFAIVRLVGRFGALLKIKIQSVAPSKTCQAAFIQFSRGREGVSIRAPTSCRRKWPAPISKKICLKPERFLLTRNETLDTLSQTVGNYPTIGRFL